MKRNNYILIFCILFGAVLQAQTSKSFIKAAEKSMLDKDYYSALEYYQTALDIKPKDVSLQYKVAESARLFNAYKLAEEHYKMVAEGKETEKYPDARFWLGQMQIMQGNYADAKMNIDKYISSGNVDANMNSMAQRCLGVCSFATNEKQPSQENVNLYKLDETVNSQWNDFAPSVMDGKLLFTSMKFEVATDKRVPPRNYAGILEKKNEELSKRVNIQGSEGQLHFAHSTFSHKKDKVYFTICSYLNSSDIHCDLYVSDYNESGWGKPVKLPEPVNASGFTTTQPSLSYDVASNSERLFFVSDRVGGKGNKDIWYVDIDANGSYGAPVNLVGVNTPEDEITPFYHAESKILYFASDGYPGLGGYDIFGTKWSGNTFSVPNNFGKPVNSSRNDLYYWINPKEDTAYFASNRDESSFIVKEKNACCNDIFLAKYIIINLNALTFESATKAELLGCAVKLYEITPQGKILIADITNPESNLTLFRLMPDKDYWVVASKSGFDRDSALVTTKGIGDSKDITQKLYLKPSKIDLQVFTFDDAASISASKPIALNDSEVELYDITADGQNDLLFSKKNPTSNDFLFSLDPCKKYRLIVKHNGYITHTEEFQTPCDGSAKSIRKDVFLKKPSLEDFLPLTVYFENDRPDYRSMGKATKSDYSYNYDQYYPKKEFYADRFLPRFKSGDRAQIEQKVFDFFDKKLKPGKDSLDLFSKILLDILKSGEKITLEVQGYTSPLASSGYNLRLGSRRVSSMINHFYRYEGGVFKSYLKSGQLKLKQVSFGESKSGRNISDSKKDLSSSIYSPEASGERKSAIIDVNRNGKMKK